MAPTARHESANDIGKRYGFAELARLRMLARRLSLNSLAKSASISLQESLDLLDHPELSALAPYSGLHPLDLEPYDPARGYYVSMGARDLIDPALPRRALPTSEDRYLYSRRLAALEASRLEAAERSDRLLDKYLSRTRAREAIIAGPSNEKSGPSGGGSNAKANEIESAREENPGNKDDEDEEVEDLMADDYETDYLDMLTSSSESPAYKRAARRIYRRRLYPFRFRPLGVTTRLMERRLRDL